MSRVWSCNEWDPLEEVIVGNPLQARFPTADPSTRVAEFPDRALAEIPQGPFPQRIIEETEEDLEAFVAVLTKAGVTVKRPETWPHEAGFSTIHWQAQGYYNYCPRDVLLVVGDQIIETPNVIRSRAQETASYRTLLIDYLKSGARWYGAPKPMLLDALFEVDFARPTPRNDEPAFDAANVLRLGRDLVYLVSATGNQLGGQWLQTVLGDTFRVHFLEDVYYGSHIDSTFVALRPGLVLVNPERVDRRKPAADPEAVGRHLQPADGEHEPVRCRLPVEEHRQRLDRHEPVQHPSRSRGSRSRPDRAHPAPGETGSRRHPPEAAALEDDGRRLPLRDPRRPPARIAAAILRLSRPLSCLAGLRPDGRTAQRRPPRRRPEIAR